MRALGGTQFNMTGVFTGRRKFRHHRQLQIGECHINKQRDTNTDTREGALVKTEAATNQRIPGVIRSWRARKDPPLETLKGAWACQYLNLIILVSRTVREHISVV